MSRTVLRLLNGIYGWIIGVTIFAASLYAGYSIWDNHQIYKAAENVQNDIRQLKPSEEALEGPGFKELQKINEDVIAWLTIDDTNIDYPVLQGESNLTYMDKNVYGEFSMAGSIFLDTRNKKDFSDNYSLIYGHNMENHLMFGDLALFKDKEFFQKHTNASLTLPGSKLNLKVMAVLQVSAGTEEIFNPDKWKNNLDGLGKYVEKNAIWFHTDMITKLKSKPDSVAVVAMVTCSDGDINDRTIFLTMREIKSSDSEDKKSEDGKDSGRTDDIGTGTSKQTSDTMDPGFWMKIIAAVIAVIGIIEIAERWFKKHDNIVE